MQVKEKALEGRTAIVTGASRGIGKAIAQRLASAGAHVVIGARSAVVPSGEAAGTLSETAEAIEAAGGRAASLVLDVTDESSRQTFVAAALEVTGAIDILVNNAGTPYYREPWTYTHDEAMAQFEAYFVGPYRLTSLVIPQMIENGQGWILNLGSSSAVKLPAPPYDQHLTYFGHDALYAASKAAVHRYSLGLAAELHPHNIAVNVVAPVGGVYTPGLAAVGLDFTPDHVAVEQPEQIAEASLALVSEDPRTVTGVIAWSYRYLDEIGRSTMSLDGRTVLEQR